MTDHCEQPRADRIDPEDAIRLPSGTDPARAAFVYPLARALRITRFVAPDDRSLITLIGCDAHTLLAAQLIAAHSPKVRVLALHDADIERCDRWGIRHRSLADAGLRNDQDIVVLGRADTSHTQLPPDVLPGLLRPRGRLIFTESAGETPLTPASVVAGEFLVSGVRGGCLLEAAEMLASPRCPDFAGLQFEIRRESPAERPARFGSVLLTAPD